MRSCLVFPCLLRQNYYRLKKRASDLGKMKHSSVLSSCMASNNNIATVTFVYTMVSHTIRLFDFSLFTVTLDLHPDSAIAVILSATAVTGPFLYLLYTLAPSRPPTCTDLIFGPSWYGCPGAGGGIFRGDKLLEKN